MLHADGFGDSNCVADGGALAADDPDELSIDIESFYKILDENSNPSVRDTPTSPEDLTFKTFFEDESTPVAVAVHEKESQSNNGTKGSARPVLTRDGLQQTSPWFLSISDSGHAATRKSIGDCGNTWMFTASGAAKIQNETFGWGTIYTHATEEANYFRKDCESDSKEHQDFAVTSGGLLFERGNQELTSKVSMLHEGAAGSSNASGIDTSDWNFFNIDYPNGTHDSISYTACDGEHDGHQVGTFTNSMMSEDGSHCPPLSFTADAVAEEPLFKCSYRELPKGTLDEISHSIMPVSSFDFAMASPDVCAKDIRHTDVNNCKPNGRLSSSSILPFVSNGSSSLCADLTSLPMSRLPGSESFTSRKRIKEKDDVQLPVSHRSGQYQHFLKDKEEVFYQDSCTSGSGSHDENEADVCIIEETSNPREHSLLLTHGKSSATSQQGYSLNSSCTQKGCLVTRPKANDESLTFRVALQDLSQIKSEANPPDGVLAVPLLRHQRIALSWMVQKETTNINCSGGILADDQGMGKTISTIALILMERAPMSSSNSKAMQQPRECETLNLDDDDDNIGVVPVLASDCLNRAAPDSSLVLNKSNGTEMVRNAKPPITFASGKGRPAAGTLIVCPTSVLRQWAEELQNKVTSKANLSVLVYHGTSRTKDPEELAKYDVVLTTYSIVSMEVPKQPFVDQDDEDKGGRLQSDAQCISVGLSTGRKRKYPPSSNNKKNRKKGNDSEALDSVSARPLARVGWYRVVLDEAQSIKNHRTQVARACWGLRAKRRWCLSGTPIQNAVDDLYSYFRFLRYEPYAIFKSFRSMIKIPINRNPANGYKKLQAVLKTIMLRRTKGTLLDGQPIINLPPKTVLLKKVDFSEEEREFYSRLEADSRAQFKEYADAGTVKQNYVNILLMLLRLRQACDHPLLVNGYDSSSIWRASTETAKRLPKEKLIHLLNCLEAGYAICGLCNDPPEDAVVAICGHVFCNQCICEHITGDDSLCPAAHCKVHLSVTAVFSKATLQNSLSDRSGQDCFHHTSPGVVMSRSDSFGMSYSVSSKIKAALEILLSLSKLTSSSRKQDSDEAASGPESASSLLLGIESGQSTPAVEKAIVFSQWTRMLDLLETPLRSSSIQYRRLDGTMSVVARDKAVKDFNNLPEVSVMIMSLKAASLGLNMVAACNVLLLDLWWNPTTEDQAIDRAHRIGQTRPVKVSRLTVKDTVEDRILALQEKKREMVASAFGEDETGGRQTRLTVEDLRYLFSV
ncbi:helicase-like transcription factor CHR28 isoform X2 [Aristolochia californica]|uniref:helicase-like transcription factor CHR28 isoform X2 n=1 Tax=Aristolochia californica TaxID=171875 RepID=UPI0035D53A8F